MKKSHGLGRVHDENRAKKWPISDDLGLRSVFSHSENVSDENFYLYLIVACIQ